MDVETPAPVDRRTAIVDAAIDVLATEGGRGLTHRAIDRRLGLPLGSTANYFSTRTSLLRAVTQRLLELDIVRLEALPGRKLSKDRAAEFFTERLLGSLAPDMRNHYIAHHEVLLQSARDHQLRREIAEARQRFVDVSARILTAMGCAHPEAHAPGVVAMLDGLLIDQLLYSDKPLDPREFTAQIRRLLAQC
ncbi:TetR/AcrR family transcriptional regulator [Mycolicibacterium sp.]|uniref:TetR/AcrR family transcriptional regulator n=1 Tax=Mycolicibacterium sp. TaxID=2320850 RepID=UPI003D13E265